MGGPVAACEQATMNTHPIGEPGKMRSAAGDSRITALRQMTPEQLLHLAHAKWSI
jgi:hypothetical protein